MPQYLVANWKMNGSAEFANRWLADLGRKSGSDRQVIVCAPAIVLGNPAVVAQAQNAGIALGGQDCHAESYGAYTGWISAPMLAELGATAVIVGHSERRQYAGERDGDVAAKARAAHAAGLTAIVCVGESLDERQAGRAETLVEQQVRASLPDSTTVNNTLLAYEPIWAIGTGQVAEPADVAAMHDHLARVCSDLGLPGLPLLYGGSVKPNNAGDLLALGHVDGALVGGASLDATSFAAIIDAAPKGQASGVCA